METETLGTGQECQADDIAKAKKKTEINLKLHTMIVLVGPSGCGKSFFAHKLKRDLDSELTRHGIDPNIQYLSSDDLRREVLGDPGLHKHDPKMMTASKAAFELLHKKIDLAMEFPTLAHYVIVDTTGLAKNFRDQLLQQAKTHNYNTACVIFDYKKNDEYFKHCDSDPNFQGWVARKHIERMRKHFWKEFNRKDFNKTFKIKSKSFTDIEIKVDDAIPYVSCMLDEDYIYDITSDVHGCINEFKALIEKLGYELNGDNIVRHMKDDKRKIILAGDVVDRGYASAETLKFVLKNLDFIIPVKGNHENFVVKWHKGLLKDIGMEESFRKQWFDTTFDESSGFKTDIEMLDEISIPFARTSNFIVTHGPAENMCLGKLDRFSQKNQMKGKQGREGLWDLETEDKIKANREFYQYVKDESERSYPYHIFGHVSQKNALKLNNKICVDTGCAQGGRLTAVTVVGSKTFFTSVPMQSEIVHKDELYDLFPRDKYEFNLDGLEPREIGRIKWSIKDKVNFISGTMSPSAADVERQEIEPIENALQYYKDNGVVEVVIQPKYMGSRCNAYIYRDLDNCFATSRKGFRIKHVDLTEQFKKLQKKLFKKYPDAELVILDGELMPWHALGEGLIEDSFKVVERGIETELDMLESTGFEKHLSELLDRDDYRQYLKDQVKGTKEEMNAKYGQHNTNTFKNVMDYSHHRLALHRQGLEVYKRQIEVFGAPGEVDYYPFAILKIVNKDGSEQLGDDNAKMFEFLRGSPCLVLDLYDDKYDDSLYLAREMLGNMYKKEMEGVVVKPRFYKEKVAPFIKVRTKKYLTIVYGYDFQFPEKYARLLKQKRIGNKLRTSINEYEIGRKMLQTPVGEITEDNVAYQKLIANMIAEEKKEERFDPRL